MGTDHDIITDCNPSTAIKYCARVNGKAMPYLNSIGVSKIDAGINTGKRFNFLENKFIETITDKHALHGREIASNPPDILFRPDVKKMAGITPPESFDKTDLLFHVIALTPYLILVTNAYSFCYTRHQLPISAESVFSLFSDIRNADSLSRNKRTDKSFEIGKLSIRVILARIY